MVWDEGRGTVICSECGTVVDSIYVSEGEFEHDSETMKGKISAVTRKFGKLTDVSVKYLMILKEIRYSPLLYVDSNSFNKYLVLGKRVKVIKRRTSIPKNETLDKIVAIMSKYPKLCSRTDRAKYAIAMIAYTLVMEGGVNPSKLSKQLGLSKTHIRRLLRVVDSSQKFLSEVRRLTQSTLTVTCP